MIKRILLFVMLMALAAPMAHAGFLVGAALGQGNLKASVNDISYDGSDFAWKAYAGFRIVRFVGVELAYRDWGRQVDSGIIAEATDIDLTVVGVLPIKKFELYGKVGYALWDLDAAVRDVVGSGTSTDGTDFTWGLGVAWKFIDMIAIRAEYEVFEFDSADDATFWSIGIDFRF